MGLPYFSLEASIDVFFQNRSLDIDDSEQSSFSL